MGRSPAPRSQVLVQSLAFGSLLHCGLVRYPTQRGVPPQHSRFIPREFAGTLLRTNSIVSVSERTTLPVSILNYSKIRFLEFNLYLNIPLYQHTVHCRTRELSDYQEYKLRCEWSEQSRRTCDWVLQFSAKPCE